MLLNMTHDYAVRIVRAAATHDYPSLTRISELENVTRPQVALLGRSLVHAGILKSRNAKRGGGYALAKPLSEIPVLDVVRAVDPGYTIAFCYRKGIDCPNNGNEECRVHQKIGQLQELIFFLLQSISMADMLAEEPLAVERLLEAALQNYGAARQE